MDHRITAIIAQKRNKTRMNIHLDGEYAFSLSRIVAAWLQLGMQLSDEKIARLQADDIYETAYQRAIKWISFRPRTEEEIRHRLLSLSVPEDTVRSIIEHLKNSQLINDNDFAERWVAERSDLRPRSRKALAYELKQHGIQPEIIEKVIEPLDDGYLAYQAGQKKARRIETLEWDQFRIKMLRYLAGRGFSYSASSTATCKIWDEIVGSNNNRDERADK